MKPISDDDIVIAGISGRFPNSEDLNAFWNNLVNSCEMYSLETERWPTSKFVAILSRESDGNPSAF